MKHVLFNQDAFEFLRGIDDETIELVITDPPYESLEKHRNVGTTTRLKNSKGSSNKWFEVIKNDRFDDLCKEFYRVLKPNSHCYIFCDQETMFELKPAGERAGLKFWKPIVWDKMAIGMGYHYRARYEFILFFEKGKRRLKDLGMPDILESKRIYGGYPAQKPVDLIGKLIEQSSNENDIVLDPFCGSGSTAVACLDYGRWFVGCDKSMEACELSEKRMIEHGQ